MARTATSDTLSSHVYEQIRVGILRGGFEPGERLKPAELRVRYGVSVSVVREALSRLAEQRLVRSELNQGFRVTPLSSKDLRDLTDIRVQIEGFALRCAIQRGDSAWKSRVLAAHYLLEVTPSRTPDEPHKTSEEWSQVHRDFHRTLIEACDMPVLLDICLSLFDASELYRRLSAPFTEGNRNVAQEHRSIMEATLECDAAEAEKLLESHFRETASLVLSGLLKADPSQAG